MTDLERVTRERDEAYAQLRISTGLVGWQGAIEARVARGETVQRCGKCGGDGVITVRVPGVVEAFHETTEVCGSCQRRGWVEVPL